MSTISLMNSISFPTSYVGRRRLGQNEQILGNGEVGGPILQNLFSCIRTKWQTMMLANDQCDQIAVLFDQNLAIYNDNKLLKSFKTSVKVDTNFAKY